MPDGSVSQGSARGSGPLKTVAAALRNGRITFAASDSRSAAIRDGRAIVVFRNVFEAERMISLRRLILSWSASTPAFPNDRSASVPGLNFHRIDGAGHRSHLAHLFHQFGFGDVAALEDPLRSELQAVAEPLIELQNRLAGTDMRLAPEGLRIKVLRHPRGGGFVAPHTHPHLPQKVAVFLNMSAPGSDYGSGEARFRIGGDWISTLDAFRCGDVVAWRYDLVHDVSRVDPGEGLSWANGDGLWILAPELVEAHGKSKETGTAGEARVPQ